MISSERVEDANGNKYWLEVNQKISYRKIGHAFRSNSRRLTAEKNAEIAVAEEAARTGKRYEEVWAEKGMDRSTSPSSTESRNVEAAASAREAVASAGILPTIDFPGNSMHSGTSSAEHLFQLEAKRKALIEEDRRLFEMRLQASMRSRAPRPVLAGVGPTMYGAAVGGPFSTAAEMRMRSQLHPALVDHFAALGPELTYPVLAGRSISLASRLSGPYGVDPMLMTRALPDQGPSLLMSSPYNMTTPNANSGMMYSTVESGEPRKFSLGATKDLPVHEEGQLVDALLRRAQYAKSSSVLSPYELTKSAEALKMSQDQLRSGRIGGLAAT